MDFANKLFIVLNVRLITFSRKSSVSDLSILPMSLLVFLTIKDL